MGFITRVEVKCKMIITQRPGGEKWNYVVTQHILMEYQISLKVDCDKLKINTVDTKITK